MNQPMPRFNPRELADWALGTWKNGMPTIIDSFHNDSRALKPGAMFIALRTESRDGHDFVEHARAQGATCAMVARHVESCPLPQLVTDDPLVALQRMAARYRVRFRGPVIGITGSCGKTSTKNLLAEMLRFRGPVLKTEGNFNNYIGVPLTLMRLDPEHHATAVIEAGINMPGEMEMLADLIRPTHGIVTNIAPVHLERLRNMDTVAAEKSLLLRAIPRDGIAVFPETCLAFPPFRSIKASVRLMGAEGGAGSPGRKLMERLLPANERPFFGRSLRRVQHRLSRDGDETELFVRHSGEETETVFPLHPVSAGMAENAAFAILLAGELGASVDDMREALLRWEPGAYRGQVFSTDEGFYYLDCYNSNPVALVDALEAFGNASPPESPRLYILGSMEELGAQAELFHREALRSLNLRDGDFAFLIGTHADAMARGLEEGGNAPDRWSVTEDLGPVRERLTEFRGAVLLKGSRRYELERLWNDLGQEIPLGREIVC